MPKYIKINDIEDGMILAEDIMNRQGYLMFSKGMELKTSHKKVFITWNIAGVLVGDLEDNVELDADIVLKAKTYLDSIMMWKCSLPIELDLYECAVYNIARDEQNRGK